MSSYHDLELLSHQRVQTLLADAAAERLAARMRPTTTRTSFRTRIAKAIFGLVTRLEPTPIPAELVEEVHPDDIHTHTVLPVEVGP